MRLNELSSSKGAFTTKTRLGRGPGSGKGKTAGRGTKGQKSRSGVAIKGFEGGQMPIHRRLPKRGFKNIFGKSFAVVNLGRVQKAIDNKRLDAGKKVDIAALVASGLVNKIQDGVRLLAKGEINTKLDFEVTGASKSAVTAVEKLGGNVVLLSPIREKKEKSAKAENANEEKPAQAKIEVKKEASKEAGPEEKRPEDKKPEDTTSAEAATEEAASEDAKVESAESSESKVAEPDADKED